MVYICIAKIVYTISSYLTIVILQLIHGIIYLLHVECAFRPNNFIPELEDFVSVILSVVDINP